MSHHLCLIQTSILQYLPNSIPLSDQRSAPRHRSDDNFLFATACYLVIDVETGELTGALAGHTMPFHIQSQQTVVSLIEVEEDCRGPALAITSDHEYEIFTAQLLPGDTVLMYTDGICEAMNDANEEFGIERLQEVTQRHGDLPLKNLLPCIVQEVKNHSNSEKLGDDICLLGCALNTLRTAKSK